MNMLFYSWEYPPNGAGVGSYVRNMSGTLARLGHRVMVVTGQCAGEPDEEEREGVLIRRCYGKADIGKRWVGERVLALARQHGAAFIEGADHLGELASLMHLPQRPPLLVRMHSCNVHAVLHASQAWYPWQRVMIRLACLRMHRQVAAERATLAGADALLVPCRRLLDVSRAQGLRLPSRCAVIPNPYMPPADLREAGEGEAPEPVLLFVGRLDMGKGIGYLPGLLQRVVAHVPGCTLELAGGDSYARGLGSLSAWLRKRFEAAGVAEHVRWLGHLGPEALDAAYRRAWVQLIPSRWDTFPGVALEGMARGKAIVASPNGGLPEMLAGTGNPVVEPGSGAYAAEVVGLLQDTRRRHETGARGRQHVLGAYAPGRAGRAYMAFVEEWLEESTT